MRFYVKLDLYKGRTGKHEIMFMYLISFECEREKVMDKTREEYLYLQNRYRPSRMIMKVMDSEDEIIYEFDNKAKA